MEACLLLGSIEINKKGAIYHISFILMFLFIIHLFAI